MRDFDILLLIGTSGSGKSTWVRKFKSADIRVISADEMRIEFTGDINNKSRDTEIYECVIERATQAFRDGYRVIIDSTNLQKDRRRDFILRLQSNFPDIRICYKLFPLNADLAKSRIRLDINSGIKRADVSDCTIDRHSILYNEMLEDIKSEAISEYNN